MYAGEQVFYGRTVYEASPLNRVEKTFALGNSWAGSFNPSSPSSEKAAVMKYLVNNSSDAVKIWSIINNALTDSNEDITTNIPWILLDEQFKFVASSSGADQVGSSGMVTHYNKTGMPVNKNGYLYIYVSNETNNIEVFFDNLQVTHLRGRLLEETHYYPWGLTMANIPSKALTFGGADNKYKYQHYELNADFNINLYESFYRSHDPQLGRFWQIDPKPNVDWSPYSAMNNNPILITDPLGDTTFVEALKNGNYNVVGGNLTGDDNGIYIRNSDGTVGNLIGYSATPESFYFSEEKKWMGNIDPSDLSGKNFLNEDIVKGSPSVEDYMINGTAGGEYDFKRSNATGPDDPKFSSMDNFYRGMPLLGDKDGKPIFASARDVGNIGAGYIAASNGIPWLAARLAYDGLQSYQDGRLSSESSSTKFAQKLGHRIGSQAYLKTNANSSLEIRRAEFRPYKNMKINMNVINRKEYNP